MIDVSVNGRRRRVDVDPDVERREFHALARRWAETGAACPR